MATKSSSLGGLGSFGGKGGYVKPGQSVTLTPDPTVGGAWTHTRADVPLFKGASGAPGGAGAPADNTAWKGAYTSWNDIGKLPPGQRDAAVGDWWAANAAAFPEGTVAPNSYRESGKLLYQTKPQGMGRGGRFGSSGGGGNSRGFQQTKSFDQVTKDMSKSMSMMGSGVGPDPISLFNAAFADPGKSSSSSKGSSRMNSQLPTLGGGHQLRRPGYPQYRDRYQSNHPGMGGGLGGVRPNPPMGGGTPPAPPTLPPMNGGGGGGGGGVGGWWSQRPGAGVPGAGFGNGAMQPWRSQFPQQPRPQRDWRSMMADGLDGGAQITP